MADTKPLELDQVKHLDKLNTKFWSKVDKPFNPDKCWNWLGVKNAHGYGHIRFNGRIRLAHRVAWGLCYGEIPEGLMVLHKCDNPSCVRLGHLYLGTALDNARDAKERCHRKKITQGRKLNIRQAEEIRKKYFSTKTSTRKLAKEYNVGQATVWGIIHFESWR